MSNRIPDGKLVGIMKAEGLRVKPHPGWEDWDRDHVGGFGPNGAIVHHTGSDAQGENYVRNILRSGYAGLPGPLCHVGIAMDGTVHLVSNGRANHAGGGDPKVLDAVVAESAWLMEREAKPTKGNTSIGKTDGNARFYGAEVMYDGGQAMTPEAEDAVVRWCAAICRYYGWSARSVIGHREWSRDKIDPGRESMVDLRRKVQARLDTPLGVTVEAKTVQKSGALKPFAVSSLRTSMLTGKYNHGELFRSWLDLPSRKGKPFNASERAVVKKRLGFYVPTVKNMGKLARDNGYEVY